MLEKLLNVYALINIEDLDLEKIDPLLILQMLYYDRIDVSEESILIKQANQKSVVFVTIHIF